MSRPQKMTNNFQFKPDKISEKITFDNVLIAI